MKKRITKLTALLLVVFTMAALMGAYAVEEQEQQAEPVVQEEAAEACQHKTVIRHYEDWSDWMPYSASQHRMTRFFIEICLLCGNEVLGYQETIESHKFTAYYDAGHSGIKHNFKRTCTVSTCGHVQTTSIACGGNPHVQMT